MEIYSNSISTQETNKQKITNKQSNVHIKKPEKEE